MLKNIAAEIYRSIYMFGYYNFSRAWPKSQITRENRRGDGAFAVSILPSIWAMTIIFAIQDILYPREPIGLWPMMISTLIIFSLIFWIAYWRGASFDLEHTGQRQSRIRKAILGACTLIVVASSIVGLGIAVKVGYDLHAPATHFGK